MSHWLDPQTKELLRKSPPEKLAPPMVKGFSLVLLGIYRHHADRLVRAIQRIRPDSLEQANARLNQRLPMVVNSGLAESDAFLGQFELISCDAISVFVPDNVISFGSTEYLDELYNSLLKSDEFAECKILITAIPDSEKGNEFVDQFLGARPEFPMLTIVPYKKARIMIHWAAKIGAQIRFADDDDESAQQDQDDQE